MAEKTVPSRVLRNTEKGKYHNGIKNRTCAVKGCFVKDKKNDNEKIRFFDVLRTSTDQTLKWLRTINRVNDDGTPWFPSKSSTLCGDHFISGKPGRFPFQEDYVPSIFPINTNSAKKRKLTRRDLLELEQRLESRRNSLKERGLNIREKPAKMSSPPRKAEPQDPLSLDTMEESMDCDNDSQLHDANVKEESKSENMDCDTNSQLFDDDDDDGENEESKSTFVTNGKIEDNKYFWKGKRVEGRKCELCSKSFHPHAYHRHIQQCEKIVPTEKVDEESKPSLTYARWVPATLTIANDSDPLEDKNSSDSNPWSSKNLKEFLFYNCPECEYLGSFESDFYEHAVSTHPKAKEVFEPESAPTIQTVDDKVQILAVPPPNTDFQLDVVFEQKTVLEEKPLDLVAEEASELKDIETVTLESPLERAEHFIEEHLEAETKVKRPIVCPSDNCKKYFLTRTEFDVHQAKVHKWQIFKTPESCVTAIKNEMELVRGDNGLISCPFKCGKTVTHEVTMLAHLIFDKEDSKKIISCKTKERLEEFPLVHGRYFCPFNKECGKSFGGLQALKAHLIYAKESNEVISCIWKNNPKNGRKNIKINVNCECCQLHFTDALEYEKHIYKTCLQCKKTFTNPSRLEIHMKTVHGTGLKCRECDSVFDSHKKLKDHVAVVHKGEAPKFTLICEHCGEPFETPFRLEQHIALYHGDGETSHMCDKCGDVFKTPVDLQNHKSEKHKKKKKKPIIQDESKRFCEFCQKMFANAAELFKHFCDQHPDHECPAKPGVDFYQCYMCQKVLASKTALYTHLKLTHKTIVTGHELMKKCDQVPTKCPECNVVLPSYMECIDHFLDNHGLEIPEKLKMNIGTDRFLYCRQCSFQSRSVQAYSQHRNLHQ